LAILLVIPHNSDTFGPHPGVFLPIAILAHAGWIGVQLFFVLSGFLITRNLIALRSANNYFAVFFGRRVLRIFPLYFSTLIVGLLLLPHFVAFSPDRLASQTNQVWLWTFLNNWVQPFGLGVEGFSHFWSLAVEEQFYLVWPCVVLACTNLRLRHVCAALIAMALLFRMACVFYDVRPEVPYMFTVSRMDALAFGALVAAFVSDANAINWPRARYNYVFLLAGVTLIVTCLCTHAFAAFDGVTLTIGQTAIAAAFATIVWAVVQLQRTRESHWLLTILSIRLLRSVGKYSFAMYVFHLPLAVLTNHILKQHLSPTMAALPIIDIGLVTIASYIAGFTSYHLLEKHFLALKEYLVVAKQSDGQQ
jgi:peptidoglycan/LPS O-acetylase OafA/YrhL